MPNVNAARTLTCTIASSASLSDGQQVAGLRVLGVVTPAAMTGGGNMSFQVSADGTNYSNLYATDGTTEVQTSAIAVSQYYNLSASGIAGMNYIKVRTGTAASPVVQGAQRLITVVIGV